MPGKLYICGTPIGNLEDVSIRLLKTLRLVDLIACEDTRHTIKLLNRYKIKNRLLSYHEHSQPQREQYILAELAAGRQIALVSDAGMPTISDPGQSLISQARAAGIEVEVIPGPSACIAALAVSGLDSAAFIFAGFLPVKTGQRRQVLAGLKTEPRTVILYEAPHRLLKTLVDMGAVLGEGRPITVVRELTKLHQEVRQGPIEAVHKYYHEHPPRGEICLLLPGYAEPVEPISMEQIILETAALISQGMDKKEAFKMKACEYNVKKSTIYKQFLDF
ncbi:MAG: 16S rRNA (cytidine(1402)-2'-O)-methyltransferase [Firmicutes bacterium]|nr:16S rRNA (cytidine(1402)-2'-O)-methyltransferase [Bacillota bacterium]